MGLSTAVNKTWWFRLTVPLVHFDNKKLAVSNKYRCTHANLLHYVAEMGAPVWRAYLNLDGSLAGSRLAFARLAFRLHGRTSTSICPETENGLITRWARHADVPFIYFHSNNAERKVYFKCVVAKTPANWLALVFHVLKVVFTYCSNRSPKPKSYYYSPNVHCFLRIGYFVPTLTNADDVSLA